MAGWGEMNLGRFRNALDSRKQGQDALNQGFQNLMRPIENLTNLGFTFGQKEKDRQLQRDLPDIQARGAANEEEWKAENRFDRLGLRRGQEAAPSLAVPHTEVQPPATTPPTGFVPETFNLPSTPQAKMAEEWSKRERPSEYGGDAYRQNMEKNKISLSDFESIIPENLRGGAAGENEAALASNVGRPYGVTVDQSAMAGARSPRPRDILPEQLKRPDTVVGPDKMAADVLPDQFKAPTKPAATAFRDTEPGQRYADGRPEGWGGMMENFDVDKKIREAKETDTWRMRSAEVEEEYGNTKSQGWKDGETMRRVFGYNYSQQGGGSEEDKQKRIYNGTLEGFLDNRAAKYVSDRPGMVTTEQTAGGTTVRKLAPGVKRDDAINDFLDYSAMRFEQNVTDFHDVTTDPRYKGLAQKLHTATKGSPEYNQTYGEVKEMLRPYVESTFDKMLASAVEKEGEWATGDIFGLGGALDPQLKARVQEWEPKVKEIQANLQNIKDPKLRARAKAATEDFKALASRGNLGLAAERIPEIEKILALMQSGQTDGSVSF